MRLRHAFVLPALLLVPWAAALGPTEGDRVRLDGPSEVTMPPGSLRDVYVTVGFSAEGIVCPLGADVVVELEIRRHSPISASFNESRLLFPVEGAPSGQAARHSRTVMLTLFPSSEGHLDVVGRARVDPSACLAPSLDEERPAVLRVAYSFERSGPSFGAGTFGGTHAFSPTPQAGEGGKQDGASWPWIPRQVALHPLTGLAWAAAGSAVAILVRKRRSKGQGEAAPKAGKGPE